MVMLGIENNRPDPIIKISKALSNTEINVSVLNKCKPATKLLIKAMD